MGDVVDSLSRAEKAANELMEIIERVGKKEKYMAIAGILILFALGFLVLGMIQRAHPWPLWASLFCLILEGVIRVFGK
jgi:hypothetical protein